jgi:hypothetical protein
MPPRRKKPEAEDLSPEERFAFDLERKKEMVHVRYIGGSDVVFPHLEEGPRCCREENQVSESVDVDEWRSGSLVKQGDVFLIDRYSAEERPDLEVVDDIVTGPGPSPAPEPPSVLD